MEQYSDSEHDRAAAAIARDVAVLAENESAARAARSDPAWRYAVRAGGGATADGRPTTDPDEAVLPTVDWAAKVAYADARAEATGRPYIVSALGHVLVDEPHNRAAMADLGGMVYRAVPPGRKCDGCDREATSSGPAGCFCDGCSDAIRRHIRVRAVVVEGGQR